MKQKYSSLSLSLFYIYIHIYIYIYYYIIYNVVTVEIRPPIFIGALKFSFSKQERQLHTTTAAINYLPQYKTHTPH